MLKLREVTYQDEYDYRDNLRIELWDDDKKIEELEFRDGEPEDNSLCRNFNDCQNIVSFIKKICPKIVSEYEQCEDMDIDYGWVLKCSCESELLEWYKKYQVAKESQDIFDCLGSKELSNI